MHFNRNLSNSSLSSETQFALGLHNCYQFTVARCIITTFTITSVVFLLPVYIFILHLGFKQWRQQSFSTMAMSHFDLFTYHMVLFELLGLLASICICYCINANSELPSLIGMILTIFSQYGQVSLHVLTCAERHLAVVHPITYRSLKGERWIRVRSLIIVSVWLFSILMSTNILQPRSSDMFLVTFIPVALLPLVVSVLCLSVLRVLMRSGPGEGNGGRRRIDQSKLRAFYVIVGVLVVLVLRFGWNVISGLLMAHISQNARCAITSFSYWYSLPGSLLMPLLYLQNKGKLLCCKKKK